MADFLNMIYHGIKIHYKYLHYARLGDVLYVEASTHDDFEG